MGTHAPQARIARGGPGPHGYQPSIRPGTSLHDEIPDRQRDDSPADEPPAAARRRVLLATLLQGITSYTLTQTLSKAAQRMITDLRRNVQEHVGRLPVAYYDANKTGALVSRIMSDVEGVRNLIGTGLVEFLGGLLTAAIALYMLLRISPVMTGLAAALLLVSMVGLRKAFSVLRPIFRERAKINAEVSGRLTESLSGVRVVKGYHAEDREA